MPAAPKKKASKTSVPKTNGRAASAKKAAKIIAPIAVHKAKKAVPSANAVAKKPSLQSKTAPTTPNRAALKSASPRKAKPVPPLATKAKPAIKKPLVAAPKKAARPQASKKTTMQKTTLQKTVLLLPKPTLASAPVPATRSKTKVGEGVVKTASKTKRRGKRVASRPEKAPVLLTIGVKETTPTRRKSIAKIAVKPTKTSKTTSEKTSIEAPMKARRVRAPKDLAAQYGESVKQKRVVENSETKRARRDAVLRQKMRDAMEVGDDLIARLRRAGMIGGADESELKNGHGARLLSGSRITRRPRKWEARCGKCGSKSLFKTAAGLCAKCGAIMVRE